MAPAARSFSCEASRLWRGALRIGEQTREYLDGDRLAPREIHTRGELRSARARAGSARLGRIYIHINSVYHQDIKDNVRLQ